MNVAQLRSTHGSLGVPPSAMDGVQVAVVHMLPLRGSLSSIPVATSSSYAHTTLLSTFNRSARPRNFEFTLSADTVTIGRTQKLQDRAIIAQQTNILRNSILHQV